MPLPAYLCQSGGLTPAASWVNLYTGGKGIAGQQETGSDRVGLCIVGCGDFARVHARVAGRNRGQVDLYFASRTYERAARYAEEYGGTGAFGSYDAAARDSGVQALLFCTPHSLHRENLELAAAYGKHVLMEKPIATTVADARAMAEVADRAGVHFMVAENFRYMPIVRKCAEMLRQGVIGRLQALHFQATKYQRPTGWRLLRRMMGGGALIDGGIHKVTVLRMLGGEPEWVAAAMPSKVFPEMEGEEAVSLLTGFRGGAIGTLMYSWTVKGRPEEQTALVLGSEGHMAFNFYGVAVRVVSATTSRTVRLYGDTAGMDAMHQAFLNLITMGSPVPTGPQQAAGDLAFVLAAYLSAESGGQRTPLPSGF